uniref:Calcium uniporter protein C-terminal domain-containing protein n=1 Tax=Aegilops tauschii TaxID=37682 RepID=M8BCH2_AEGTA
MAHHVVSLSLVVKAIEKAIPIPRGLSVAENHPAREELKAMEAQKVDIDRMATLQVRRELWGGLAALALQTAGFMRLTFWELSWDVMEPICFFVTSTYFMAGYAFFLRTKREPSFEGFFQSRFVVKQKRLMKARDFDPPPVQRAPASLWPPGATPSEPLRVLAGEPPPLPFSLPLSLMCCLEFFVPI